MLSLIFLISLHVFHNPHNCGIILLIYTSVDWQQTIKDIREGDQWGKKGDVCNTFNKKDKFKKIKS